MKRCLSVLMAVSLLLASGCTSREEEGGLRLWYTIDLARWGDASSALDWVPYEGEETVSGLLSALFTGPGEGSDLVSPFPSGTYLQQWTQEDNRLTVDLSWPYGDLVGVELTLADYCITLTLTQLEGVEEVCITSNGSQLPYRDRQVFTRDDVMFTGAEEEAADISAALYYRRRDSGELGYELRVFRLTENDSVPQAVLEGLLAGPQDQGLEAVISPDVTLLGVRQEGSVCYVDFSAQFLEDVPQGKEEQQMVVDSILNTLCSLETVSGVQILVEGELIQRYGQIYVGQPLIGKPQKGNGLVS